MAKDFARKFKKLVSAQVEGQSDNLIGTVLSVHPIEISCHGGQWLLTADDLQISNHVSLQTGDSVVLSGEDPFSVISVLSDADPDEYEPPRTVIVDDALSDMSKNPVQNKVVSVAINAVNSLIDTVQQRLSDYVSKSGDTISGNLTVTETLTVKKPLIEPISTPEDDWTGNWRALGNGICFYRTLRMLNKQPSQWGYLINITGAGNDVRQVWTAQGDGSLYHRTGNGSGWSHDGEWIEIADANNIARLIPNVPDSGWTDVTFAEGYENIYASAPSRYRKVGNMVQLHICMKGLEGNWKVVATLPEGYRPDVSLDVVGRYDNHNRCTFNISSDGTVTFISTDGSVGTEKMCSVNATFLTP